MTFAFHISRDARERYGVRGDVFTLTGNAVLPDFAAGRRLAQAMNERDGRGEDAARAVHAGQLNAMGLLDEILHAVAAEYRAQVNPRAMTGALAFVGDRVGPDVLSATLAAFADRFPTAEAADRGDSAATWLAGGTDGVPNPEIAIEELLMLWLGNANPAFGPFRELFDDAPLVERSHYGDVVASLVAYFGTQPPFGPEGQTLVEMLRAPAIAVPDSIAGQLRFVRERWLSILARFGDRLLTQLDVLAEEEQGIWRRFHPTVGGGTEDASRRASRAWLAESGWAGPEGEAEPERFSVDRDWMPRLVLIAKSTFVWLDQLSKRHGRLITRLDEIPDEDLDQLARWGFTGLWLIGLWQRSQASQTIKQLRGNPEAVASAYSLDDYRIADDLGGEEAFERLKARAWQRGLRIASDMVPNHMGVDSQWVVDHPDWFMSLPEPPYPVYRFTGPDLSHDERVGIQIEDHYFDNTDAAVVFRRWDRATGDARYVYHGNDGTSMPWNDTAQLDYLKPEVREAVIQAILGVARRSPVIRFDAAMTLAKRHIERLWYPEPGQGGGIPSRAEHAMTKAAFERAMPVEFWREVVDRVAAEVPDTLLLAEAFWLMEGYFVRTLGMHRVYNSAFMNMLRDEQNEKYRAVIRNTLEFEPEVLKRYVNFMNNPDEKTAVEQFGKGDKYFGVATLMATLPGLPMFGHGQVEGFTEKYGMEYRRAYRDEQPDGSLVERHEREIAPLLQRRHLFAEADDFLLFDLVRDDGTVDEDVYAYTNRGLGEASLVLYNNRYDRASGRIRESVPYSARVGEDRELRCRSLADALALHDASGWFLALHDLRSGLEFLHDSREVRERGLALSLDGYACRVFLGIRELQEAPGRPWGRLATELAGRGVPSLEDALNDLVLRPVQDPLGRLLRRARVRALATSADSGSDGSDEPIDADLLTDIAALLAAGRVLTDGVAPLPDPAEVATHLRSDARRAAEGLREVASVGHVEVASPGPGRTATNATSGATAGDRGSEVAGTEPRRSTDGDATDAVLSAADRTPADVDRDGPAEAVVSAADAAPFPPGRDLDVLATVAVLRTLARSLGPADPNAPRAWIDEWRLGRTIADALRSAGNDESDAWRRVDAVKILLSSPAPRSHGAADRWVDDVLAAWLADDVAERVLLVNVHRDIRWFNREAFEELARWTAAAETIRDPAADLAGLREAATALVDAATASGYRLDQLRSARGAQGADRQTSDASAASSANVVGGAPHT